MSTPQLKTLSIQAATIGDEPGSILLAEAFDGAQYCLPLDGPHAAPDIRAQLFRLLFRGAELSVNANEILLMSAGQPLQRWAFTTGSRVELAQALARSGITASAAPAAAAAPIVNVQVDNHIPPQAAPIVQNTVNVPERPPTETVIEHDELGTISRMWDRPLSQPAA